MTLAHLQNLDHNHGIIVYFKLHTFLKVLIHNKSKEKQKGIEQAGTNKVKNTRLYS